MQDIFKFYDDLGPAKILHVYEPQIHLKGVLVVDNVAAGPSVGGIRMAPDVSTEECFRLARAMTLKNAAAGLAHGGGKAVIYADPKMPSEQKEVLIRGFANALRDIEEYILAPDMGTDEKCMAWIKDEIGRVVGLPRELGGIPLDEIGATGWGIRHAVDVALADCDFELAGARLVVQGFGAVGRNAAHFLVDQGAILVGTCDSLGSIYNPNGLDVERLMEIKDAGESVTTYADGEAGERDAVIDMACDIWIPAARPDVIHAGNVDRLQTRLVVEGANIPITHEAEQILHQRGVLCLPDFIANAGGVICAAMEYKGATKTAAFGAIEERLRRNTRQVLDEVKSRRILPREAALDLALKRVKRAMSFKRWAIF
ncbi:MAG: Glu/Leu/Phe/Val dehydrogenase [Deltaproteobacteria bacterium]|jgi:glutamate dehydrogenase (NAD(P)+)|nr:Glu/Leu/Phe/Val dehydrogenase [Deltaproteobacteria bacterium]